METYQEVIASEVITDINELWRCVVEAFVVFGQFRRSGVRNPAPIGDIDRRRGKEAPIPTK